MSLVLYRCTSFWTRLRGLHGRDFQMSESLLQGMSGQRGLYLFPCCAVHTLGVRMPIDVVFVDADLNELKLVACLRPNRISLCPRAKAVIELPGGYCQRHPDYLCRIQAALTE